ncbi:MAG: AHH domain-containing protein [Neomegalonema sp.]|nr:AHH domain-containing protein [Neomegalonema sp.]
MVSAAQWGGKSIPETNAHHIIPQSTDHPLLDQLIAKDLYDIHDGNSNRIDLPSTDDAAKASGMALHRGSHPGYDQFVREMLDKIHTDLAVMQGSPPTLQIPEAKLAEAQAQVRGLQAWLADGLMPSMDADGQAQPSKLVLNAVDPRVAEDAPKTGRTQYIYDSFYKDISWEDIKSSKVFQAAGNIINADGGIRKQLGGYHYLDDPNSGETPDITQVVSHKAAGYELAGITEWRRPDTPLFSHADNNARRSFTEAFGKAKAALENARSVTDGVGVFDKLDGQVGKLESVSLAVVAYSLYRIADNAGMTFTDLLDELKIELPQNILKDVLAAAFQISFETAAITFLTGGAGTAVRLTMEAGESAEMVKLAYELLQIAHPEWGLALARAQEFFTVEWHLKKRIAEKEADFDADSVIIVDDSQRTGTVNSDLVADSGATSDFIDAYGTARVNGGAGDDFIIHHGAGKVEGGAGNDILVGNHPKYFTEGELLDPELETSGIATREERLELDGGLGDDYLFVIGGQNAVVRGGQGEDEFKIWSYNVAVDLGDDQDEDEMWWSPSTVVANAGPEDRVSLFGIYDLQGGIAIGEGAAWAMSPQLSFARYTLTTEGHLVINFPFGNRLLPPVGEAVDLTALERSSMLVLDYVGGPDGSSYTQEENTFDIYLAQFVPKLLNILSFEMDYSPWSEVFGAFMKARGQRPAWDPLVIDLDGDGLETSALSYSRARFDLDLDGFAELTGWVRADDGILALDYSGNGVIDDISELFGSADQPGFEALAALDENGDGVIDAADSAYGMLQIWRDLDQDGISDEGELTGLAASGIAALSLSHSALDEQTNSGHTRTGLGTVTLSDGTIRALHEMSFPVDEQQTRYLGDTTIADFAAALPEVKGFGQLTDLRLAASKDLGVWQALQALDGALDTPDLSALIEATDPLLRAWAKAAPGAAVATPVLFAQGVPVEHAIWQAEGWQRADGSALLDAQGDPITTQDLSGVSLATGWAATPLWPGAEREALPFAELAVFDHPFAEDDYALWLADAGLWVSALDYERAGGDLNALIWPSDPDLASFVAAYTDIRDITAAGVTYIDAELIDFAARIHGLEAAGLQALLPGENGAAPAIGGEQGADLLHLIGEVIEEQKARIAVRLAAQDELAEFFTGLPYDPVTDSFRAATSGELRPLFTAIFDAAPSDGLEAYLAGWASLLPVVYADFNHKGAAPLTSGMLTANLLAAHASSTLPLSFAETAAALGIDTGKLHLEADLGGNASGDAMDAGHAEGQIFVLGAGDSRFDGGQGTDVYIVGPDWGSDVIDDREAPFTDRGGDTLRFAAATAADLEVSRDGLDLVFTHRDTGDMLRIVDQFEGRLPGLEGDEDFSFDTGVAEIIFADGELWMAYEIADAVSAADPNASTVTGTPSADVIRGGAGDDILIGGRDGDIYEFNAGDGHDIIRESNDAVTQIHLDSITFGGLNARDALFRRIPGGQDLEISFASGEVLTIENQFQSANTGVAGVVWGERIELFFFDDIGVMTFDDIAERTLSDAKTAGDDTILGIHGRDLLDGGAGDDLLIGGPGDDTYVFARGYGTDTIREGHDSALGVKSDVLTEAGNDRVEFGANIAPEDLLAERLSRTDLALRLPGLDGAPDDLLVLEQQYTLTASGLFEPMFLNQVEWFEFADGTTLSEADIRAHALAAQVGSGRIEGFDAADTLSGSAADEVLAGFGSSDTYIWGVGAGNDTIEEDKINILYEDEDRIVFDGLAEADVSLSRAGDALVITITATGETLTIAHQFHREAIGGYWNAVERFEFTDAVLSFDDVALGMVIGGAGDDTISGSTSNETFIGGEGDDLLQGDGGSDTYIWGYEQGSDTIHDYRRDVLLEDVDRVVFEGIASDAVAVARSGNDLIFTLGDESTLTIKDHYERYTAGGSWRAVEEFVFTDQTRTAADYAPETMPIDGSEDAETLTGTDYGETLYSGGGDDRMEGAGGSDIYMWGAGHGDDRILDDRKQLAWEAEDRVEFIDLTPSEISIARENDDLILTITATGESLTIEKNFRPNIDYWYGVETIHFADGTIWDRAALEQMLVAQGNRISGSAGDDILTGTNEDEVFEGLGGDDLITGGNGSDIYLWRVGEGSDVLHENGYYSNEIDQLWISGATLSQAQFSLAPDTALDALITIGSETIRLKDQFKAGNYGIETLVFEGGETLDKAAIQQMALMLWGTDGADSLSGTTASEAFAGGLGDDTLSGGDGSDTYLFRRGDGADVIDDNGFSDTDTLWLRGYAPEEVLLARGTGADLLVSFTGTADQITIRNTLDGNFNDQIEQIRFEDGTIWTAAEIRNRLIAQDASDGDDLLTGFAQAETLSGGLGNDTLSGKDGSDLYLFAPGDGQDAIDENGFGDTDVLHLTGYTRAQTSLSHEGADLLLGFEGSSDSVRLVNSLEDSLQDRVEVIRFADGEEIGMADARAALLEAQVTSGDDTVTGFSTADVLTGGAGDDLLEGMDGSDIYRFAPGDGHDVIHDRGFFDTDRVELTGHNQAETSVARDGDDLVLGFEGGDSLRIENTLDGDWTDQIEQIAFADGSQLTSAQIAARFDGLGADISHVGTDGADLLLGSDGHDAMIGGSGADRFVFESAGGLDRIEDFGTGDLLDLRGVGLGDFASVQAAASLDGSDTLLDLGAGASLRLVGITPDQLSADQFVFG